MSVVLTVGTMGILGAPVSHERVSQDYTCNEAKRGCMPSYVFSVPGQVQFRSSLHHLSHCSVRECRHLQRKVMAGSRYKLRWLMDEDSLLGCVQVQPYLYGSRGVILRNKEFPAVARHLAHCPKESCAQLRRSLLLTIRDHVSPNTPDPTSV